MVSSEDSFNEFKPNRAARKKISAARCTDPVSSRNSREIIVSPRADRIANVDIELLAMKKLFVELCGNFCHKILFVFNCGAQIRKRFFFLASCCKSAGMFRPSALQPTHTHTRTHKLKSLQRTHTHSMLAAGEKDPEMPSPTGQTLKQPLSTQQPQPVYNAPPQQYQQQPQYNAPSQQPQYSSQPQVTVTTTTPATATAQPQQTKTGGGGGGNGTGAPARRPSAMDLLPTFNYVTLIDWHRLNVLVMFFAFIVFVDACLIQPRGSLENYQIGVGAASFGVAFITFLISIPTKFENEIVKIALTTFQFLWWSKCYASPRSLTVYKN